MKRHNVTSRHRLIREACCQDVGCFYFLGLNQSQEEQKSFEISGSMEVIVNYIEPMLRPDTVSCGWIFTDELFSFYPAGFLGPVIYFFLLIEVS